MSGSILNPPPLDNVECEGNLAAQSAQTSRKRSRILFSGSSNGSGKTTSIVVPPIDPTIQKLAISRRLRLDYPSSSISSIDLGGDGKKKGSGGGARSLTNRILGDLKEENLKRLREGGTNLNVNIGSNGSGGDRTDGQIVLHREEDLTQKKKATSSDNHQAIVPHTQEPAQTTTAADETESSSRILSKNSSRFTNISVPTPKWHAPWELSTVISSHLGWVRSIAFDPTNDMFATGAADRTIKVFDFAKACVGAEDALKVTLTGHIGPIRGMAFSPKHPYLFTAGEDKMVKCWDLETNQVVRHYHGHLSGVFDLKLHPTLDILVTGGRDAVARVWDMRTKHQIHCLTGHDSTVGAILTKGTDPQVITGSYDSTIKLWDLAAGKCMSTLTHHKKSVRALAQPSFENTFLSGAADTLKKWTGNEGRFIKNFSGHAAVVNALAINDDGVAMSGADDGSINFWDYKTGYTFQKTETVAQPGSLDAENGVFVAEFDLTGTRLVTGEADKSIKIWKQAEAATEDSHPVDMVGWRRKCVSEAKQRY